MEYVHNIKLNFNKHYYDFFEWNEKDKISDEEKIPLIRININDYSKIINYIVKLDDNTAKFINDDKFIITDTRSVCAIKINKKGETTLISSLQLDDEFDIIHISLNLKEEKLNYKILNKRLYYLNTRKELKRNNYLLKNIAKYPFDKLKYIYYECFNITSNNKKEIITNITKAIKYNEDIRNKIYDIVDTVNML